MYLVNLGLGFGQSAGHIAFMVEFTFYLNVLAILVFLLKAPINF